MAILQIWIDDETKLNADELFSSLGLDTETAVRIFLKASIEHNGLPFVVRHTSISSSLMQAIEDSKNMENLYGPFSSAQDAVTSMLDD